MPVNRPVRADMSFPEFVATRPIPANGWGDFVRIASTAGGVPDFKSWEEVRRFVESYREINIRTEEVRRVWRTYSTMIRTAQLRLAEESSAVPGDRFMDGAPVQFTTGDAPKIE